MSPKIGRERPLAAPDALFSGSPVSARANSLAENHPDH